MMDRAIADYNSKMQLRRHDRADEFLAAAGAALRRRPVINQLPLAFAGAPERYRPNLVFYSVADGGAVCGAAAPSPPWPVQLAESTPAAAALVGEAFGHRDERL